MTHEPQEPLEDVKAAIGQAETDSSSESKSGSKYHLKLFIRLAVVVLVGVWIAKTLRDAGDQFSATHFSVSDLDLLCVMLAALSYLIGLVCFGLFWHLALHAMGQRPTILESLRSYILSHLGKYVPGKALVVIIRSDRVSSSRVKRSVAVVGVFVETLGMMAVGGILASLFLLSGYGTAHESGWLTLLAVGLAVGSGVGASPPMFRFVLRYLSKRRGLSMLDEAIDGLSWQFLAKGWFLAAVGWLFFGASMIFVLWSFPPTESGPILDIWDYPQVIAAVSLSMVAGFLSLLPGGAGVREMVISTLLTPMIGPVFAVISAISLRVVWLLCELGAAAGFLLHYGRAKRSTHNEPTNSGV
ncbi:MAG TPA: flippase-like domain-containing protein [Planctomycetes bacterium]|nr:flippase-like domain-containing protein [Planctomycetaceae bacterium]HIN54877.1 flippase-like domain-containing protein [Planctomycetota bacterium]